MLLAGELGSTGLPAAVDASQQGKEGEKYTVIRNAGAIELTKTDA